MIGQEFMEEELEVPAEQYSITTGDAAAGNTSTRTVTPMIDPYQSITPSMLSFDGSNRETGTDIDGSPY